MRSAHARLDSDIKVLMSAYMPEWSDFDVQRGEPDAGALEE